MANIGVNAVINDMLLTDQGSAPPTPSSGTHKLFTKSDGLYLEKSDGSVVGPLASGVSGGYVKLGAYTVAAMAVSNVNIASAPSTIDGIAMTSGDIVLLENQTTASEGGPWVYPASSGSPFTRPTWWASGTVWPSATPWPMFVVLTGSVYAGALVIMTTPFGGTLAVDTTAVHFTILGINVGVSVTGILPVTNGGTGAALNSTGGFADYLKQLSSGVAITVDTFFGSGTPPTLTIASNAVTITATSHIIESSSGTSDTLKTINGGTEGMLLLLQADADDTVTVHNYVSGSDNIKLNGGFDFTLSGAKKLLLFWDGTYWSDVGAGGAGGSVTSVTASAPLSSSGGTTPNLTISDATPSAVGVVKVDQTPPSGDPRALTNMARNVAYGLSTYDPDRMDSSLSTQLRSSVLTGVVTESNRWVRSVSNPLFGGTNGSKAQEPQVLVENGTFKMWYTHGDSPPVINYATSTDGITWTQYGSNPVFTTNNPAHIFVTNIDGTYYMYYANNSTQDLYVTTSADGITWNSPTLSIAFNAYTWTAQWASSYVWTEGATWHMLIEYRQTSGGNFQVAHFTGYDGITWTLVSHSLTSLQPGGAGGEVCHPFMPRGSQKRNGLYHLWTHGNTTTSVLPTDLYHQTSPDLTTWTVANSGNAVLVHTGSTPETDQVADPCIVEFNGTTYLYFTEIDDSANRYQIGVCTWAGALSELIDGSLDSFAGVEVNGGLQTARPYLDLEAGTNVTLTATDDPTNKRLKVTIASSGGGGGTPTYPQRATLWWDEATVVTGSDYVTATNTSQQHNSYAAPGTNGDAWTQSCVIAAGTYTLYTLGVTLSDSGMLDYYVDGVLAFSGQDWYGSTVFNVVKSGSITISAGGYHVIKLVINGKNGSSSGYNTRVTKSWIKPTSD